MTSADIARLPVELVLGTLATTTPSPVIAAANTELSGFARDPHIALAWSHHILASSDSSIMDVLPAEWWSTPAAMDSGMHSTTRGLPTPATWLMKRLVHALVDREVHFEDYEGKVVEGIPLAPSPLSVPAVVDWMLHPRRCRPVHTRPLNEVVRDWDVPGARTLDQTQWSFDAPEPLASRLAAPRLRPVPEGLQLPLLYLYTGELDRFMAVTRRLAATVPTLTTATAAMALWMRLGIDDRESTRANLSGDRRSSGPGSSDSAADEPPILVTLPTYWAVVAAGEGRASVLEFLVTKLAVDPFQLTAFLSRKYPTFQFFLSLIQHSAVDRVMPTWHWLIANGYVYPVEECGFLSIVAARAAEYQTMRTMFLEYDKPRILAERDRATRLEMYEGVNECVWGWVSVGHYALFSEFAEVGILTPRCTFPHLFYRNEAGKLDELLPLIESLAPCIEGGMDAVIDYGLDRDFKDKRFTIQLTYRLRRDQFKHRMNKHDHRPHFVEALASVPEVHDAVDQQRLLINMVQLFRRSTFMEPDDDPEDLQYHLADFHAAIKGISGLLVQVLCSDSNAAVAVWAAIRALSPAQRVAMFGKFAHTLPTLDGIPASKPAAAQVPQGWTGWQYVLDRILPSALDSPTDLMVSNPQVLAMVARGIRSKKTDAQVNIDNVDVADLPTVSSVLALPLGNDPRPQDEESASMPILRAAWFSARLCQLAPDPVLPTIGFTATTPLWLWQMRLDALMLQPADGWRPAPLENWITTVGYAMASSRNAVAMIVLRTVSYEEKFNGRVRDPTATQALHGMAQRKWPALLDMAREAGLSI